MMDKMEPIGTKEWQICDRFDGIRQISATKSFSWKMCSHARSLCVTERVLITRVVLSRWLLFRFVCLTATCCCCLSYASRFTTLLRARRNRLKMVLRSSECSLLLLSRGFVEKTWLRLLFRSFRLVFFFIADKSRGVDSPDSASIDDDG